MEEERGRQARIAETAAGAVGEAPAPSVAVPALDPELEALLAGAGDDPELRQAIIESMREHSQQQQTSATAPAAPEPRSNNQVFLTFSSSF